MKRILPGILLLIIQFTIGWAQSTTNIGTDFWVAFPPNYSLSAVKQLYISSVYNTSGSIQSAVPGVNQSFTVTPGIVTQITLPIEVALSGGVENKGIHITANDPIAVYGLNNQTASTDAFLALPVNALGLDYRILTYPVTFSSNGSAFSVVATQDGTELTVFNHQTNVTTTISLNTGETYHVEVTAMNEDVTGSRVQSNFPVSVFSSVKITQIPLGCTAADHIVEQVFPCYSWGRNYVTVPLAGRDNSGDVFRILAAEDGTEISINETVVATINAGDHYMTTLTGYNTINCSEPSLVGQFAKGESCSGGALGDPLMMLLLPKEQYLTDYTIINVAGVTPFNSHWVNLVAPDYALGTILQDGILVPVSAFVQIGSTNYYGAQCQVTQGSHTFTSPFPFGVSVYGWCTVDSYGYPGGGSMAPVTTVSSVSLSPDTLWGDLNITNVCLTANVLNSLNNPVEGVLVNFYVSGINPLVGNDYTDASGDAHYCYTQTGTSSGIDQVYAEVFGLYSDTSIVYWTYLCNDPTDGGTVGNDQSGCGTFLPQPLVNITLPSGQEGTLEYLWQQSVTGSATGFTDIAGTNSPDFTPGTLSQTTWFRRLARVTCSADWTGAAASNVLEISVYPELPVSITISASLNPVCAETPVTFTAAPVNGGTSPTFQWQVYGTNAGTNSDVFTYYPVSGDQVSCILTSNAECATDNPDTSNQIVMSVSEVPHVSFSVCFDSITTTHAKPILLRGGIPLGGTYSGTGVTSSTGGTGGTSWTFDPAIAGAGIHQITYHYTNSAGCLDSASIFILNSQFSILNCGDSLTDVRDNKKYPTVQIGSQCWMAAGLNYGNQVAGGVDQRDNCTPEKYCYDELTANCEERGATYQWDELMQYRETESLQGLCPPEWHVPSEPDWEVLFANWTNNAFAGKPLLYTGFSGFNALLTGVQFFNRLWEFEDTATFLWSSTSHGPWKAWAHAMNKYDYSVSYYPSYRINAFSVRCVRD